MEKANPKAREYRFFSQKNQKMVCLHSEQALAYARYLEDRLWVAAYDACVPLGHPAALLQNGLGFRFSPGLHRRKTGCPGVGTARGPEKTGGDRTAGAFAAILDRGG